MRCHSRSEIADACLARLALAFAGALLWWLIVSAVWGYAFWLIRGALADWAAGRRIASCLVRSLPRFARLLPGRVS